jgi:hypothetical protein
MLRKIVFAFVLLMILAGAVSANQTTVGDYKFNIPDDYEQDHSMDIVNQTATFDSLKCHVNSKTFRMYIAEIKITVTSPDNGEFPDYYKSFYGGGHDATLKGMDGYISLMGRDYLYSYIINGDWVEIKSWDLYGIEDIIVA